MASGALPVPAGTPQGDVNVGVRPHEWELTDTAGLSGVVRSTEFQGDRVMASVDLSGDIVVARFEGLIPSVGESIQMWTRRFHLFLPNGRSIARITNV